MSLPFPNHPHLRLPSSKPLLSNPPPPPPPTTTTTSTRPPRRNPPLRCLAPFNRRNHLPSSNPSAPLLHVVLPSLLFFSVLVCFRLLLGVLPPDFPDRWRRLLAFAEKAEVACVEYPEHLAQAVVAAEDSRFFRHVGVDPVGIARAVVYFPRGGGGSTITQQLVKNVFLKSERKVSRKVVEMVLALALERRMSKRRILYTYLSMVYWGHGMYGIESASLFYFGKHPSFLTLGESATLAGILPAPELRSPLIDPSRGNLCQLRVLKRMVILGFLDIYSAILVVKQPLYLDADQPNIPHGSNLSFSVGEDSGNVNKQMLKISGKNSIWDWELASRLWEAYEDLELWVMRRQKLSTEVTFLT